MLVVALTRKEKVWGKKKEERAVRKAGDRGSSCQREEKGSAVCRGGTALCREPSIPDGQRCDNDGEGR